MKHLYRNDDGEIVAADSAEQAGRYHDIELGGEKEIQGEWSQIPDDVELSMTDEPEPPKTVKKSAREWASEHAEPMHVSTTYT